jgi:hypothetical protein
VHDLPCTGTEAGQPCYDNGDEVLNLVGFNKVKKQVT